MVERITARQFHDSDGVGDWRAMLYNKVGAHFRTGSFATGVALVEAIGRLAEAANHHPEVDLRSAGVSVWLTTDEVNGLSELDVALARRISQAARAVGALADPGAVQQVSLTIDALVSAKVKPFWQALLGYREWGDEDLVDPLGRWSSFWFQDMDAPRPQRNRIHLDIAVPHDQAQARVAAAVAAGGRVLSDAHAPTGWILADPEGNEACVTTWLGRD